MLKKKLLRTALRYKSQFISMIIMIALGIGVFVGFNMEWVSIEENTDYVFEKTGFADFRLVSENGFSKEDFDSIMAISGVKDATRYISINTTVKDDTDVIALTVSENISVSGFMLIGEGKEYDNDSKDEIWLSDQYAEKNNIKVGDKITLTYKNIEFQASVAGLIKSSEYLICLPDPTLLMPDYNSYGFAYISPEAFKEAMGMEFYTQINVLSDMDKEDFSKAADKALSKTTLVLSKDDTVSYSEAMGEVNEGKTMGSILPVLFIAIAVLTMVTTMHRITSNEKTQIGTLKSLGFRDRKILVHYSSYAFSIGIIGTILGIGIGYGLAYYIMNPYGAMGTYIDMPTWNLYMPSFCIIVIVLVNLFLTFIGFLSVKKMLHGTAAEALRPYVPSKMKRILLERTKLWNRLGFGTKWNMRDIIRHKARTGMTLFGIIGCAILIVGGLGMQDTMNYFVDVFYNKAINYQTRINISEQATNEQALEIAKQYNGDYSSTVSIDIAGDPVSLEIYNIEHDRVRIIGEDMGFVTLNDNEAYISKRIADDNGIKQNDLFTFSPYGSDEEYTVKIAGISRSMTESVVMSESYAKKLGIDYKIIVVYTNDTDIKSDENIANTQTKQAIIDSFDVFMELMTTMVFLLVIAAIILGVVVLYNLGIMNYIERYRELATLKVVGFRDKKIGGLLIMENLYLAFAGIIVGIPLGLWVLDYLIGALASEYEMVSCVTITTYIISIVLTVGVSLFVSLIISKKNKKIDMVEALKATE